MVLIQPALDWHRLALTATLWPVGLPYLNQSWTLSYEFLFYIACAAFLLFGRVTLIAVPLALACEALLNDPYSSFIGNPLILEFLGGAASAPGSVTLHLQVKDADAAWNRAIEVGAKEKMPLADQFWGDRYGQVTDPFGFSWSIGAPVAARAIKRLRP